MQWLPWKYLIKRAARRYGIIDPIGILARLRQFSQPSEVQEPIELLRAGILFHARGLINTRAIQYNLDWVWPFWVEKQFNPSDISFIPRGFSFSHVNLTHRSWTAVGQPDIPAYPIVDPRGLVTPLYDGWSIDCAIITDTGVKLLPSKSDDTDQAMETDPGQAVVTRIRKEGLAQNSRVETAVRNDRCYAVISVEGKSDTDAWLVVGLRPYNPEGIQFIESIEFFDTPAAAWRVNRKTAVCMDPRPDKVLFSNYHAGDVLNRWDAPENGRVVECPVGMATGAAFFRLSAGKERSVSFSVDMSDDIPAHIPVSNRSEKSWANRLSPAARLDVPDELIRRLYDIAVRTLILFSADDPVPGPYTYRRFWFRDACLMLNAMMAVNLLDRAFAAIDRFPARQRFSGYFRSQEGEWDSNGQLLWIMDRYFRLTGSQPTQSWLRAMFKGARWIERKRTLKDAGSQHGGLLPSGFSAEHLGPNDYYYWDDFWGLAGLDAAARIAETCDLRELADQFTRYRNDFYRAISDSLKRSTSGTATGGFPASPYRRMDAGAIGSLVADYPLQLFPPADRRIMKTVEFLIANCFHQGAFFQDMIHSGLNMYLTLAIAQTLLRAGDIRYRELVSTVAGLASPTGQWPEAIHPQTRGGCMGDGQHAWAAAEWVMMIRNLFVREEEGGLIIGSGLFPEWLCRGDDIRFGPTPTPFGPVSVTVTPGDHSARIVVAADWRTEPESVSVQVPGYAPTVITGAFNPQLEIDIKAL